MKNNIIVVPVMLGEDGQPRYIMVASSSTFVNITNSEFIKGTIQLGQKPEDAIEILMARFGYKLNSCRFIYRMFVEPDMQRDSRGLYLASIDKKEVGSFAAEELTAEELHKKIIDNDIIDAVSLAAFSVVLLQSQKATEYLVAPNTDNKEVSE